MRIPHLSPESFRTHITVDKKIMTWQQICNSENAMDAVKVKYAFIVFSSLPLANLK